MQLCACGFNEAANLKCPPSCRRYYIRRSNPCVHNDWGKNPDGLPYCPFMVLKPVEIAEANSIRVIASLSNTTILDVDGKLKFLGHQYPEILSDEEFVRNPDNIMTVLKLDGLDELGILLKKGGLMVLRFRKDGGKELVGHEPAEGRTVEHLAVGLYPQCMFVVPRARPSTIFRFTSWKAFLEWSKGSDDTKADLDATELPSVIDRLIGNMDAFTALLQSGHVYCLSNQISRTTQTPAVLSTAPSETLEGTAISGSSTVDADAEEPDISALLSDTPSSPPTRLSVTSLQVTLLDVPAVKVIATHPSSTVTGLITADGAAYLLGPRPEPNSNIPCLPSLSSIDAPQSISLPLPTAARINSIAIGQSHTVIMTSTGDCYSAGDGKAGQLGIGNRVFAMRANGGPGVEFHPHAEEPEEYAEQWERVDLGSEEKRKVKEVIAGAETTFFLVE